MAQSSELSQPTLQFCQAFTAHSHLTEGLCLQRKQRAIWTGDYHVVMDKSDREGLFSEIKPIVLVV